LPSRPPEISGHCAAGVTVRKTIDLLIGTWCIENRRALLHNDSDFRPMARLGLIEVPIVA
jgi:predicted nucleic acid-binding protein